MNEREIDFLKDIKDSFDLLDLLEVLDIGVEDIVERFETELLDKWEEIYVILYGEKSETEEETEV